MLPEEDLAAAVGKKFGEDWTCSSKDMIVDRQTYIQTRSSQYFTSLLTVELLSRHRMATVKYMPLLLAG